MLVWTNEEETYEELNSQLPSVGDTVTTSDGLTGTVHSLSMLQTGESKLSIWRMTKKRSGNIKRKN